MSAVLHSIDINNVIIVILKYHMLKLRRYVWKREDSDNSRQFLYVFILIL